MRGLRVRLPGGAEVAGRVALADGWWKQADRHEGRASQQLRRHAADLYEAALPELTGLGRKAVEERIAEARNAGR